MTEPPTTRSPDSLPNAGIDGEAEPSRYVVGIDLGTTNCALAFVDTSVEPWRLENFSVPQWVDFGIRESRETLPSFHYQPTTDEARGVDLSMPWENDAEDCVGTLARDAGLRHPGRRIQSAKSWLSHDGVDRSAEFLPWHGDSDVAKRSPVQASAHYLAHLRGAWDASHPEHPLAEQDVVVTLPASFDEVARELTIQAAKRAGLPRIQLIEEPQAAFYAWIDGQGDDWATSVKNGDLILVCDIGGGTTDLTLIRVKPAGATDSHATASTEVNAVQHQASVQFHRVAVGKHLILGGDNLDLAIAKFAEEKLVRENDLRSLAPSQWERLVAVARTVKETMLGTNRPASQTISVPSGGARLVGGAMQTSLTEQEVDSVLVDGFFPRVKLDDRPRSGESGFQEFGLPYAADPAVTRHLAEFLRQHHATGIDADDAAASRRPDLVLFNGGVMQAERLRQRIVDSLARWFGDDSDWKPRVLSSARLDLAVARGAAYYAMVRRGVGIRIAANLARTYYLQIDHDPPTAATLIPASAEPGKVFTSDQLPLQLRTGVPVEFPLWVSSTRLADAVGEVVPIDRQEMSPLPPLRTVLKQRRKRDETTVDVVLRSELSEIGTISIHCVETESGKPWKLDFDIRSTLETDREAHAGSGEAAGIVDPGVVEDGVRWIDRVFGDSPDVKPGKLVKPLQSVAGMNRRQWPPTLLRSFWAALIERENGRRRSEAHEARWLNLLGYCLRPGYGVAADDWRIGEVWRKVHGKLAFGSIASRVESLILWRRIAGGLSAAQQMQIAAPWINVLLGQAGRMDPQEVIEAWRMVGALESLPSERKRRLVEQALKRLSQAKHRKLHPALIWSIGRLASRRLVDGPIHDVIGPDLISAWIESLLKTTNLAEEADVLLPLTLALMTQRTGDRYRDVDASTRDDVLTYLKRRSASEHLTTLVSDGGVLESGEQDAVFGETLPLGIHLGRQAG